MIRFLGAVIGFGAQVAFHLMIPALIWFMVWGASSTTGDQSPAWGVNTLLLVAFALPHSLLLWPPVRNWWCRTLPSAWYGSLFTWATVASLAVLMTTWQPGGPLLWHLSGPAAGAMVVAAALSWLALGWSMHATGFGWQTGWTTFWAWWRHQPPPPRSMMTRGPYRVMRHPIYLSFTAIAWTTPVMDLGHLHLSLFMTAYCLLGSVIKDRRLRRAIGPAYVTWMATTPGWPGFPPGPLGVTPPPRPAPAAG